MATITEIDRWREAEVGRIRSQKEKVLAERGDILRKYRVMPAWGNFYPEDQEKLDALERQLQEYDQQILAVEHEALQKAKEPILPESVLPGLEEELEQLEGQRELFSYQLFYQRMDAYKIDLDKIEAKIARVKNEIERAKLAAEYAAGLESKEVDE